MSNINNTVKTSLKSSEKFGQIQVNCIFSLSSCPGNLHNTINTLNGAAQNREMYLMNKFAIPRNEDGTMRRKAKVEYPTTLPIFRPWLDEKNLWHEDSNGEGMIPMPANMVPLWACTDDESKRISRAEIKLQPCILPRLKCSPPWREDERILRANCLDLKPSDGGYCLNAPILKCPDLGNLLCLWGFRNISKAEQ